MTERVLDPQVEALLAQMAELGQPPFEQMTVQQAREAVVDRTRDLHQEVAREVRAALHAG
jgi:hypothetical protein